MMPIAGLRIMHAGTYDVRVALGLTLGGILAAFIVRELPLDVVRWLVAAVVIYTALSMLWTAAREAASASAHTEETVRPQ